MTQLNLPEIRQSLINLKSNITTLNHSLSAELPGLSTFSLDNMITGYKLIGSYVIEENDLISLGRSVDIFEINVTVLYGNLAQRDNQEFKKQIKANEKYFFEKTNSGIGDFIEFHERQSFSTPWLEAAEMYIRLMLQPQLFVEGNHRTGALLISYVLLRNNLPPFVLNIENAKSFFEFSAIMGSHRRKSIWTRFKRSHLVKQFAEYLKTACDSRYLLD